MNLLITIGTDLVGENKILG